MKTNFFPLFNLEAFGLRPDENSGNVESETEDTGPEGSQENGSGSEDISLPGSIDPDDQDDNTGHISIDSTDTARLRLYYKEAVKFFNEQSYLIAEFYFNKIKYSYLLLQDHIFYYLAKSLLLQEKYDQTIQIRHVNVSNISSRLMTKEFLPNAIISTTIHTPEIQISKRKYVNRWTTRLLYHSPHKFGKTQNITDTPVPSDDTSVNSQIYSVGKISVFIIKP